MADKEAFTKAVKELEESQDQDFQNVKWHIYSFGNQYILTWLGATPWEYATAIQWRAEDKKIKKWERGFPIRYPVPFKKEIDKKTGKDENKGKNTFRRAYIFGDYQVE